jgi:hypothetical protein
MKTAEQVLMAEVFSDMDNISVSYDDLGKRQILQAMESFAEQFKPKWISIKDELPNHCWDVLVCFNGGDPEIGRLYNRRTAVSYTFVTPDECSGIDATHWMPLPEKP